MGKRTLSVKNLMKLLWKMEDALFISVRGENAEEVPKELVIFLKFVKADLKESQEDFHDIYVKQLQNSIRHIKESCEMEERFMILEEMLRDERAAGRREERQSILRSFLEDFGSIPPELEKKLFEESDATVLKNWLKIAATSKSIEEFIQKISNSLLDCQVILCFWVL